MSETTEKPTQEKETQFIGSAWLPSSKADINVSIPAPLFGEIINMLKPFVTLDQIFKKAMEDNLNSGNFKAYTADDLDDNGRFKEGFWNNYQPVSEPTQETQN